MLTEAVILAGGLGTRLKSISGDTPKPMVEVAGKPFIYYILDELLAQNIKRVVIAVSYKSDVFIEAIGSQYGQLDIVYSIEKEALGTGGAIKQALQQCHSDYVLVTNGDTFLEIDIQDYFNSHRLSGNQLSMALVQIEDVARYGSVTVKANKIISFNEKGSSGAGFINGGMYLFTRKENTWSESKFSFEDKVLKKDYERINPYKCDGYFIDIGIPGDYYKACETFKK